MCVCMSNYNQLAYQKHLTIHFSSPTDLNYRFNIMPSIFVNLSINNRLTLLLLNYYQGQTSLLVFIGCLYLFPLVIFYFVFYQFVFPLSTCKIFYLTCSFKIFFWQSFIFLLILCMLSCQHFKIRLYPSMYLFSSITFMLSIKRYSWPIGCWYSLRNFILRYLSYILTFKSINSSGICLYKLCHRDSTFSSGKITRYVSTVCWLLTFLLIWNRSSIIVLCPLNMFH